MTETGLRSYQESVVVAASATKLYDLVSDVTRTGEWSPVCTGCRWDAGDEPGVGGVRVGAWFTGRNELPHRIWETRSLVVVAERGRAFAWAVGGSLARWGFTMDPVAAGSATVLTESWAFLPEGIAMFEEKFGDNAQAQIADRTQLALEGIPVTLRAIQRIAESPTGLGGGYYAGEGARS